MKYEHVAPHLTRQKATFAQAAELIRCRVAPRPDFWCYYGAYDWYWFCRLFGGFMQMPQEWPQLFNELYHFCRTVPNISGAEHNALNDARSIMAALKKLP